MINLKKGIYYDDTYTNVSDLVAYSSDIIDRYLKTGSFRLDYSITKVYKNSSFRLSKSSKFEIQIKPKMKIINRFSTKIIIITYSNKYFARNDQKLKENFEIFEL